jgi:nucleoside 2-deoxyribosyltransferase
MPFTKPELTEIYQQVIKPTVENDSTGLICKRADDIKSNRVIMQDIWKSICEARIIIADMTGLNPNVMYELGIAHTLGKETILLNQKSNEALSFPFDLSHIRRIEYENTATGGQALKTNLEATLKTVLGIKILS